MLDLGLIELPFLQICVCASVSPYLYIEANTHTHTELFVELIC